MNTAIVQDVVTAQGTDTEQDMADMEAATTVTILDQAEDQALHCLLEVPHLLVAYLEAGQDKTDRRKNYCSKALGPTGTVL